MKRVHWRAIVDELYKCEGDWCWLIDHSVVKAIKVIVVNNQKGITLWLVGVAGAVFARLHQQQEGNAQAQGAA